MSKEQYGVDSVIQLNFEDWSAVLAPEGAALKSLMFKGSPIVVVPEPVSDFTFAGSTLAPWANRLEDSSWKLGEVSYQGEITEVQNANGLHGLLVKRDFEVTELAENAVTFKYSFGEDAVYPFAVDFSVRYELTDQGLTVTFAAQNRTDLRLPISFGSHPYFAVDADSKLKISAKSAAINNARQLPIGTHNVSEIGLATREFKPVVNLELDDCIFEFEGGAVTLLSRSSIGLNVKVWQDETLGYQMLFVRGPKFAGNHPVAVAIEPQSSPANALRTLDHAVWMNPGETVSARWGIGVETIEESI